jgi:hypothetical protein
MEDKFTFFETVKGIINGLMIVPLILVIGFYHEVIKKEEYFPRPQGCNWKE